MKTKGRRQSTNVGRKQDHPTEAQRGSGTYQRGIARKLAQDKKEAETEPRSKLERSAKNAVTKAVDDTTIRRKAADRGYRIEAGREKGPRPTKKDARKGQDREIKRWALDKSNEEFNKSLRKKLDKKSSK